MITKLPKWSEWGAFFLALIAGSINGIGLLGFKSQSVSHLSGTVTALGHAIANTDTLLILHLVTIALSFFSGAMVSGFFLKHTELNSDEPYDRLFIFEAGLLILAILPMVYNQLWGLYFIAMACGMQNAMVTRYSSAVIRTTHVTGIMTDLGLMAGAFFRGEKVPIRKMGLFIIILLGFLSGGVSSVVIFTHFGMYSLIIPAMLCIGVATGFRLLKHFQEKALRSQSFT